MTSLLVGSKSFSFKHKNFQKQTTSFSVEDFPFHVCLLLTTIRVTVVHPLPKLLQVTLNYIAQKTAIHTMKRTTSLVLHDLQPPSNYTIPYSKHIPRLQEAPHQLSLVWFTFGSLRNTSQNLTITNLNRTGINHTALLNFCKALPSFCDHIAV